MLGCYCWDQVTNNCDFFLARTLLLLASLVKPAVCHLMSFPIERPKWQRTKGAHKEINSASNCSVSWEADPAWLNLEMTVSLNDTLIAVLWETLRQKTHLSCAGFLTTKLWDNKCCCFKTPSFGAIYDATIDNTLTLKLISLICSHQWIFWLRYYISQLQNFHLVLF